MSTNKNQGNIEVIRTAMIVDGTTFHFKRGETIYRVLTLNEDGSGTVSTTTFPTGLHFPVHQVTPTWFTSEELKSLAALVKGWEDTIPPGVQ